MTVVAHDIGPFGGMEAQLAELVRRLLVRGVRVTAIGRRVELDSHPSLVVVTVPGPRRPFPLAYPAFFVLGSLALWRHRSGPVYTIGAIAFNRAAARKVPFCHVAWARSQHRGSRASRAGLAHRASAVVSAALSRAAERLLYRPSLTGNLVAMSQAGALELEQFFPKMRPVAVIPNGIDPLRFRPDPNARKAVRSELNIPERTPLAVFVGGDWHRKGLPLAIEALALAPGWRLLIVGDGDRRAMELLAAEHGVLDRVAFSGRVSDAERYLAAADALAMPSTYEPWGNAVLEAESCGLPVIVCRTAGVLDFVDEHGSGLFVEPEARAVAGALRTLGDEDLRARMGARARERATEYSFDHVADLYVDLLLGTISRRPPGPVPAAAT